MNPWWLVKNRQWYTWRCTIFLKARALAGIGLGEKMPWPCIVLNTILFPFERLRYFLAQHSPYNRMTDTYTIHGEKYTGDVFRSAGGLLANGPIVLYRSSANTYITCRTLTEHEIDILTIQWKSSYTVTRAFKKP